MSRIIEITDTQIKNPKLLEAAIESASKALGQPIDSQFRSKEGNIVGGDISIPNPHTTHADMMRWKAANPEQARALEGKYPGYFAPGQRYLKSCVRLKFSERGAPVYDEGGNLLEGYFSLVGDEDFQANHQLGRIVSDHYQALVVKETLEAAGQQVVITVGENGAIQVDGYLEDESSEVLAVAGY